VVALILQRPYLQGGVLSGLDSKMVGFLSSLEEKGFLTGKRGEAFLLAGQNMIMADKILLIGLGRSSDYGAKCLVDGVRDVSFSLDKLKVNEFGIHIPVVEGFEAEYPSHLELSARHLTESFLKNHNNDSDFFLKVIFCIEKPYGGLLKPTINRLREYFSSLLEFSIITDQKAEKTA
jgi:hypothetical protein